MPPPEIPPHADLSIESRETVWQGRYPLEVVRFRNRRFDGTMSEIRTWELWRRGRAGAVLPYDPLRDCVVLIDQFRLPAAAAGVNPVMVEVPAGLCAPGEDSIETIRREAIEEAALNLKRLHPIGDFVLTPGGCDERVSLWAAEVEAPAADADGLAFYAGLAEENEDIRVRVWRADAAIEAAVSGAFGNVVTTVALLWLAARRDWLRALWRTA